MLHKAIFPFEFVDEIIQTIQVMPFCGATYYAV